MERRKGVIAISRLNCKAYKPNQIRKKGIMTRQYNMEQLSVNRISYAGDNRLVCRESSYRKAGSAPRCRLIFSSGCRGSEGQGCSPSKKVRELGLIRRESVLFLCSTIIKRKRNQASWYERIRWLCTYSVPIVYFMRNQHRWVATYITDKS